MSQGSLNFRRGREYKLVELGFDRLPLRHISCLEKSGYLDRIKILLEKRKGKISNPGGHYKELGLYSDHIESIGEV